MKAEAKARLVKLAAGCLAFGLVCTFCGWLWVEFALPDPAPLARTQPRTSAFIERARESGQRVELEWVGYAEISDQLKIAVVVAEDINFFDHHGFDTFEVRQALHKALHGARLRGASTITQQLAKNLWLSPERSMDRKVREALLTWKLERTLSKHRILELYLNLVQFGPGVFGAATASQRYFGIPPAELSEEQAAELAAGLSRPSTWHPGVDSPAYRNRVERILKQVERASWLRPKL